MSSSGQKIFFQKVQILHSTGPDVFLNDFIIFKKICVLNDRPAVVDTATPDDLGLFGWPIRFVNSISTFVEISETETNKAIYRKCSF